MNFFIKEKKKEIISYFWAITCRTQILLVYTNRTSHLVFENETTIKIKIDNKK